MASRSAAPRSACHGPLVDYLPTVRLEKCLSNRILGHGRNQILPQKAQTNLTKSVKNQGKPGLGPVHSPPHVPFTRRLRNYFLTGIVIAAPLGITLYVTWSLISIVDEFVKPLIPSIYNPDNYLPFFVPGWGLLFAVIAITLVGFLTATLVGRSLVQFSESILARMPFVSILYRGLKQLFETVVSQSSANFKNVGLIEYPRPGLHALVFLSTETKGEVAKKLDGETMVSVFLPTTPNPTSGFLLFVPRKDIKILDMSVEDGAKLVISAGLVEPEYPPKPKELTDKDPPRSKEMAKKRELVRKRELARKARNDSPPAAAE
jgi:uncharacterized membrane protein